MVVICVHRQYDISKEASQWYFCDILSKGTYARRVRIPRYTLDEFQAVVAIACVDGTMSIIKYSFVYSFELIACAGGALKLYCKQD